MSNLNKIRGNYLKSVSTDTDVTDLNNSEVIYNTTTCNLKSIFLQAGAWTAGGALGTARRYLAGAGTNTAALGFSGYASASTTCTESYNGSAWTAGGAMATARRTLAGAGASNTAALAFGGTTTVVVACTESYSVTGGVCQL